MGDLEKFADASMFHAAPMKEGVSEGPQVFLLWMTPDPLGAIAAACRMYEGKPTYSLASITDQERWYYAEQVQKTHLQAPLEFVKFHFFIEGIDRAMTHQIVRQRTAVFAQESLRFAVKENMAQEAIVPPSILTASQDIKDHYDTLLVQIQEKYNYLIANGIPAEDARAILPHCVSTRLHYCTDLRNLKEHSGNRLCTQAQFAWRALFSKIVGSIKGYNKGGGDLVSLNLFKPACYQQGKCPFTADFDRGCTIRERVQLFSKRGIPSQAWGIGAPDISSILPQEWMYDPQAGWL